MIHPSKKQLMRSKEADKSKDNIKSASTYIGGLNQDTSPVVQRKENKTGLPDQLKSGIESLSGHSMDDVRVHYNSDKPHQLQAHAFAQGNQIHIAPGQERHLPHEAWHVIQQKQGRVQPTRQLKSSANINDDVSLEREADIMGTKAAQLRTVENPIIGVPLQRKSWLRETLSYGNVVSRVPVKTIAQLNAAVTGSVPNVAAIGNNDPIFTIGATHTGDMYQVKAAREIAGVGNSNILIWGVANAAAAPHQTIDNAEMMATYFGGANVYYTHTNRLPRHLRLDPNALQLVADHTWQPANPRHINHGLISEGGATSIIMFGLQHADNQDVAAGGGTANRNAALTNMEDAVAPHPAGRAGNRKRGRFNRDLTNHGHFRNGLRYVIVNFRQSGHRAGGVHPELDTGETGFRQLMSAVRIRVPGAVVVPMGEYDPENAVARGRPNLIRYWTWPSAQGRTHQAGLIKQLKDQYQIVGAIGMRSGVMDQLALTGIPIISIDAHPTEHNSHGDIIDAQDGQRQKALGWDRGMKLEKVLGAHYGRAFIQHNRPHEGNHHPVGWTGKFSRTDRTRIEGAIGNYFGVGPTVARDDSHPLSVTSLNAEIPKLEAAHGGAGLSAGEARVASGLRTRIAQPQSGLVGGVRAGYLARLNAILPGPPVV